MKIIALAAALSLAACVTSPTVPPGAMDLDTGAPSRTEALTAVATTAASIADAIGAAPPATLSWTAIDEKAIRAAFLTFDRSLDVIDGFVASGIVKRGTPIALAIRRGILATQAGLNAASAAQRAGNASSYTAALRNAQAALSDLTAALAR